MNPKAPHGDSFIHTKTKKGIRMIAIDSPLYQTVAELATGSLGIAELTGNVLRIKIQKSPSEVNWSRLFMNLIFTRLYLSCGETGLRLAQMSFLHRKALEPISESEYSGWERILRRNPGLASWLNRPIPNKISPATTVKATVNGAILFSPHLRRLEFGVASFCIGAEEYGSITKELGEVDSELLSFPGAPPFIISVRLEAITEIVF